MQRIKLLMSSKNFLLTSTCNRDIFYILAIECYLKVISMKKNILLIAYKGEYPQNKPYAAYLRLFHLLSYLQNEFDVIIVSKNSQIKKIVDLKSNMINYKLPVIPIPIIDDLFFQLCTILTIFSIMKKNNLKIIYFNSCEFLLLPLFFNKRVITHYDVLGILSKEEHLLNNRLLFRYFYSPIHFLFELFVFRYVILVSTINITHQKIIKDLYKRDSIVIRDAFEEELIQSESNEFNLKKSNENIVIIYIGSLIHDRLNLFLHCMVKILKKYQHIECKIFGDGPYLNLYKQKYKHIPQIQFLGYTNQKQLFFHIQNADIAFSDVWSEIGFPFKLFEYMVAGTPVIVYDTPAVKELFQDNIHVLYYHDDITLYNSISKLIVDTKLRFTLSENMKRMAKEGHTWRNRARQLIDYYYSIDHYMNNKTFNNNK